MQKKAYIHVYDSNNYVKMLIREKKRETVKLVYIMKSITGTKEPNWIQKTTLSVM